MERHRSAGPDGGSGRATPSVGGSAGGSSTQGPGSSEYKQYEGNTVPGGQHTLDLIPAHNNDFPDIKLHLIGKLQTNKVKYILPLFDYIHSLDNIKLAEKISLEQEKKKFKPKIFIQVNIGEESQKSGIDPMNLASFLDNCTQKLNLHIVGLMCIPPISGDTNKFFKEMHNLKNQHNLSNLSMGMSSDYIEAINHEATFVRIGSKIFGDRD